MVFLICDYIHAKEYHSAVNRMEILRKKKKKKVRGRAHKYVILEKGCVQLKAYLGRRLLLFSKKRYLS